MTSLDTRIEGLPEPHTCPWWVQYVLVSPLRRLGEPPATLAGPHVQPGMTVVDTGCGFGYLSIPLARLVGPEGRVVSVDIEPRAVAKLEHRARRAGIANRIDARACTTRDLGLADYEGRVDRVFVIHTLHELADLPGFLGQVTRLLKPGGRLIVVEPRGHVQPEQFSAEIEVCRSNGFRDVEPPAVGKRRMTAVLAPACALSTDGHDSRSPRRG